VEPTNNVSNAAGGIGDRMPRAGLCRVAEFAPVDVGFQLGTDAA
jgi:hypothetical protein